MRTLIIIPTFLEYKNLTSLIPALLERLPEAHILVVDDGSTDGTLELMQCLAKIDLRVHFVLRKNREGLGRAYMDGFTWGLARNYDVIVQMDADHSHRIEDVTRLLERLPEGDFVIGSRRVVGGEAPRWGLRRRLLSWSGNRYAQFFLGREISDWTGGINAWRRSVLEAVSFNDIKSHGYAFQIELKYRALRLNFRPIEVPIIFEERREGQSKMSFRIIAEAFAQVWRLRTDFLSQS